MVVYEKVIEKEMSIGELFRYMFTTPRCPNCGKRMKRIPTLIRSTFGCEKCKILIRDTA